MTCWRFWGGYCFDVVCPSCLFPSGPVGYGLRTVDQRDIVKSLASYHWQSGKAVSCLQRSEKSTRLWQPGRSLKDWLPLNWLLMVLNPILTKNTTRYRQQTVKTNEYYIFLFKLLFRRGIWIFSKFACLDIIFGWLAISISWFGIDAVPLSVLGSNFKLCIFVHLG